MKELITSGLISPDREGRVMTYPEEQKPEMERDAAKFEKLLEQAYRLSTAQEKTRPTNDRKKKTLKPAKSLH